MHRRLIPLLAAAVLVPAGDASATRTVDYAVSIETTADYNRADADEEASAQHDIALVARTEIPRLTFHGDAAEDSSGARGSVAVTRGSYVIAGESSQVRCRSHAAGDVVAGGLDATRGEHATTFAVRVIERFSVRIGECDAQMPDWAVAFGGGSQPVGAGIWDGAFTLPHGRIGEARIEVPLQGEVTGSSCPFSHARTALCSLTWQAKVVLVRVGERETPGDDVPLVPLVPGPAAVPSPPAVDDLLVPLLPRLADGLRQATVGLRCPDTCRATLTATTPGRTLDRRSFRLAAGRRTTLRARFDAADRRAIRRAGGVRLALRIVSGAKVVRHTSRLRVG